MALLFSGRASVAGSPATAEAGDRQRRDERGLLALPRAPARWWYSSLSSMGTSGSCAGQKQKLRASTTNRYWIVRSISCGSTKCISASYGRVSESTSPRSQSRAASASMAAQINRRKGIEGEGAEWSGTVRAHGVQASAQTANGYFDCEFAEYSSAGATCVVYVYVLRHRGDK